MVFTDLPPVLISLSQQDVALVWFDRNRDSIPTLILILEQDQNQPETCETKNKHNQMD